MARQMFLSRFGRILYKSIKKVITIDRIDELNIMVFLVIKGSKYRRLSKLSHKQKVVKNDFNRDSRPCRVG